MAALMKISEDRVQLVAGRMFSVGIFLVPGVSAAGNAISGTNGQVLTRAFRSADRRHRHHLCGQPRNLQMKFATGISFVESPLDGTTMDFLFHLSI